MREGEWLMRLRFDSEPVSSGHKCVDESESGGGWGGEGGEGWGIERDVAVRRSEKW